MNDLFGRFNSSSKLNDNLILSDLDKIIKIKYHKDKNKNRTCVYGIFDFISEGDINSLIKMIKKRLGCSGIISEGVISKGKKTSDISKVLVFSGNHIEEIKEILLEEKITDESHIKI